MKWKNPWTGEETGEDDPEEAYALATPEQLAALARGESGGSRNPYGLETDTGKGFSVLGKYQISEKNLPEWGPKWLGRTITKQEFLNNPEAQETMAKGQFGEYVDKYGPGGASRAWFAGEGGMGRPGAQDRFGTSVAGYEQKFLRNLGSPTQSAMGYAPEEPTQFKPWPTGQAQVTAEAPVEGGWKPWPGSQSEAIAETPTEAVAPAEPQPGASHFMRGLVSTGGKENIEAAANFLEGFSNDAPESFRPAMRSMSEKLRGYAKDLTPQGYERAMDDIRKIGGVGDAANWAMETIGSAIGSSVVPAVAGVTLGGAGAAVGGPAGAVVGGTAGAFGGSYAQNYGDVYEELRKAGLSETDAHYYAKWAGVPMAALDTASLGGTAARFAKKEVARNFAGRLATELGLGATREGVTETAQEAIQAGTVAKATDKQFLTDETLWRLANAAAGGVVGGGAIGAPAAFASAKAPSAKPDKTTDELIQELGAELNQPVPVGPEAVVPKEPPPPAQLQLPLGEPAQLTPEQLAARPVEGMVFAEQQAPQAPVVDKPYYSALLRAVEEKMPNEASGEQWIASLNQIPGVKRNEVEDTGVESFIRSKPGKVSKTDVIEYLEENSLELVEQFNVKGRDAVDWDRFISPGPINGYVEFKAMLPHKVGEEAFRSEHWDEPNVLGHARGTWRLGKAGEKVFQIEEIQSDWAQEVRRLGTFTPEQIERLRQIREALPRVAESYQRATDLNRRARERFAAMQRPTQDVFALANRTVEQTNALVRRTGAEYQALRNEQSSIRRGPDGRGLQPPVPTKSEPVDLILRRMYKYAADHGAQKVSWVNGDMAAAWATGAAGDLSMVADRTRAGLQKYYDEIVPSKLKKIAKQYGGVYGETEINVTPLESVRVGHVTVPPQAMDLMRRGVPLYDKQVKGPTVQDNTTAQAKAAIDPAFLRGTDKAVKAYQAFARKFGIEGKIDLTIVEGTEAIVNGRLQSGSRGLMVPQANGRYGIWMFAGSFQNNLSAFLATLMHEFGHVVVFEKFLHLPQSTKLLMLQEFYNFRSEAIQNGTIDRMLTLKRPPALWWLMQHTNEMTKGPLMNYNLEMINYHLGDYMGFHEYMADQVARWATTAKEPLTLIEKSWAGISKTLRSLQEWMAKAFGVETRANLSIQNWLDSFLTTAAPMAEQEYVRQDIRSQIANQRAVTVDSGDPNISMPPRQIPTSTIVTNINRAFSQAPAQGPAPAGSTGAGRTPPPPPPPTGPNPASNAAGVPPPAAAAAAAHADRIHWIYELFGSILDLAARNPNFTPLHRYIELARDKDRKEKDIHNKAVEIVKQWRGLGKRQAEGLAEFLDEITNMTYLSPQERQRGVQRHPTPQEIAALAKRLGLGQEALSVAVRVRKFSEGILDITSQLAREEAMKIIDPAVRVQELTKINASVAQMKQKPYFPFMRFGRHFVTVKNANGVVQYFETFERKGLMSAERQQQRKAEEMRRQHPTSTVEVGLLPKTVEPFMGLPPNLIDLIKRKLTLTPAQLDALDQLKFQLSPSLSFQHHFQHKRYTPGYSRDFMRAFSRYAFHAGRYYGKTMYVGDMQAEIANARAAGGNVASRIADFMSDHLQNAILDVKGDYGTLKGLMFFYAMGFSPASATLNMTQTPMVTFPFLAAHFGAAKAAKEMSNALGRIGTFYKRGTYENLQDWEFKALSYGIRTGRIVETQASELAGFSQGGIFKHTLGGNAVQQGGAWVLEKSSWMFEMAEQYNRRIAFRAALKLAHNNPDAKIVKESLQRYQAEYQDLINNWGFSPIEAQAVVTAGYVTDRTQFVYAGWARPKFMRGRLAGSIFIFKRYIQSLLFLFGSDMKFAWRYALIAALMGGVGGLPYMDDLKNLVQAVLRWMGFNADVETELQKYIKDFVGDAIPGDMVLHGLARRGFGIPQILDMLGSLYTGRPGRGFDMTKGHQNVPFPQLDRSKAITSTIVPEQFWKLGDPGKDPGDAMGGAASQALGYGFSAATNLFKALTDTHLSVDDPKRWEKAMPRAAASISKMYRAFTELEDPSEPNVTRERSGGKAGGSTVVRYDMRDPEQVMEVIMLGLGYNDLRRSNEWNRIIHQAEHTKYIDAKRKGLLEAYHEAWSSDDDVAFDKAKKKIDEFNDGLSDADAGKRITQKTLDQSVKARERTKAARESNVPVQRGNRGIAEEYESVYPRTIDLIRR